MAIFHQNTVPVQLQIKTIINKNFPGKKSKPLLINCLSSTGYVIGPPPNELSESSDDEEIPQEYREPVPESEFVQSFSEQGQSSLSQRFNRTFIEGDNTRLHKLQTYGISQDEVDYNELNEEYETVLNKVSQRFPDLPIKQIKEDALNNFIELKKIYKETKLIKGTMKGKVKLGYTLLLLYYSLIRSKVCVTKEELIAYFDGKIDLSDLSTADKNIRSVFSNLLDNVAETCLCNMRNLFDRQTINIIENAIIQLQENEKIHSPALTVEVAAIIHHFTKTPLKQIGFYANITPDTIKKTISKLNL